MRKKVEEILDKIRPGLMADGGNVELVKVDDGVVSVRLTGACSCCGRELTNQVSIDRGIGPICAVKFGW